MATERKKWFKVAESILREDMTPTQRSTFLGLLAWFNQRRQRDGHRGRRAQEASIPPGDLLTITLQPRLELAREFLLDIEKRFDLTIEERGVFTWVQWPNLSKFQEWGRPQNARAPGKKFPADTPADFPPTHPLRNETKRAETKRNETSKKSKTRGEKTGPIEELSPQDYARVREHFVLVSPGCVALDLDARIESALRYHRREGHRFVDWAAAVIDNITSLENRARDRVGEMRMPSVAEARATAKRREAERAAQPEATH